VAPFFPCGTKVRPYPGDQSFKSVISSKVGLSASVCGEIQVFVPVMGGHGVFVWPP